MPQLPVSYAESRQDWIAEIASMLSAAPCCGAARRGSASWHPSGTGAGQSWGTNRPSTHSSVPPTAPRCPDVCLLRLTSGARGRGWRDVLRGSQHRAALGASEPQMGMAGGPRGRGAGGFPASSSGGHEKRRTDTYPGSFQTDFFLLLKISIPQWGCSCDRGLFISMPTASWFPIPLAL